MTKRKRCAIVDEHPKKTGCETAATSFAPCKLNNESITVVEETAEVSTFESAGADAERKLRKSGRAEAKSGREART